MKWATESYLPSIPRYAWDANVARVCGGIRYRFSPVVGQEPGAKIPELVVTTQLLRASAPTGPAR